MPDYVGCDYASKVMKVANINYDICRTCKNGACENRLAKFAKPDRIAALCNRTCLCHLEEAGELENKFERPFRTSEYWSVGDKNTERKKESEKANVLGGNFSKDGDRRAR